MGNPDIKRSIAEQTVHRFSYASQLLRGAEAVRDSAEDNAVLYAPGYLLISFALENAAACFLIGMRHPKPGDYKSHDVAKAFQKCKAYDLVLSDAQISFVARVTPLHKEHVFRYPEKMDSFELPDLRASCRITREILSDIDVMLKIKGFDVAMEAEKLPLVSRADELTLPRLG